MGEVKDTCVGQWFPNCGVQTPHARMKYMMSAKKGKGGGGKCASAGVVIGFLYIYRNILGQVLGLVVWSGCKFICEM